MKRQLDIILSSSEHGDMRQYHRCTMQHRITCTYKCLIAVCHFHIWCTCLARTHTHTHQTDTITATKQCSWTLTWSTSSFTVAEIAHTINIYYQFHILYAQNNPLSVLLKCWATLSWQSNFLSSILWINGSILFLLKIFCSVGVQENGPNKDFV